MTCYGKSVVCKIKNFVHQPNGQLLLNLYHLGPQEQNSWARIIEDLHNLQGYQYAFFHVFFVKLTHYFISLCVIKFLLTRHNFTTAFHINYSCCLCKYHYTFRPNAIWLYIAEVKRWILVANLSVIIHPSYSTWNAVHLSVRFHSERWMTSPR